MKNLMIILLVLSAGFLFAQEEKTTEGTKAPNFILEDIDGDDFELSEALGEGPVIISFWATWCKPCRDELKELTKIYEELEEKGLTVLAISTDDEKTVGKVKPFVKSKGIPFTVLLDTNSEVIKSFSGYIPPHLVILDKAGSIVYTHSGYSKGVEIEVKEIVEKLING